MISGVRSPSAGDAAVIRSEPQSAVRDALMAIGLLLTTATQLRLPGLPLGPGEFCLALWIGLTGLLDLDRYTPLTSALRRLLTFWALFILAQSLGTLTGMVIGDKHDPSLFWHDVLAYPLVCALSCLSVLEPGAEARLRRCAEIFVVVGAGCLVLQLGAGWDLIALPMVEPWFEERFRGWSNNPNQLAFLCAVLVLVSIHLADTADRGGKRSAALLCVIPAIIVGRLTKTDTFTFSLAGAVPIYLVAKLRFWLGTTERKLSLRTVLAWTAVVSVPLVPHLRPAVRAVDGRGSRPVGNGDDERRRQGSVGGSGSAARTLARCNQPRHGSLHAGARARPPFAYSARDRGSPNDRVGGI